MIRVTGYFHQAFNNNQIVVVPLDKKTFHAIQDHVNYSMFFACRRIAPKYKMILLNSIGDHLSLQGEQDLQRADISIEVSIKNDLKKSQLDKLDSSHSWYICCLCGVTQEAYIFSIDRETQYIKTRDYVNNTTDGAHWDALPE